MAGVATGSDASGERGTDAASRPSTRIRAALAVGLVLLTAVAYAPVFGADFVSYDDDKYVTANPMVQQGLGAEGVRWAFTSVHDANWIPLVWVSLMVDHQLWGLDAGGYHATNVGLHAISALLLLAALSRLTGAFGPSLFVAILFALHPLHVQSVAWVSERKDTLSGLFWMATLLGYAHYVARPSLGRYLAVGLLFALGLLSKATLVTLPFVLLLLDAWPAARIDAADRARALRRGAVLVAEKLPLFALAAAASFVTLSAQTGGGARAMGHLDLGQRAANAIVAYITYLWKTLWPFDLAFFYPHGEWLPTSSALRRCW